jgi:hypothetical protein
MTLAQARAAFPALKLPKPTRQKRGPSKAEELFYSLCEIEHLPQPEREFCFAIKFERKWRFDFAWPALLVAVEIEGLTKKFIGHVPYAIGRHCTFKGFAEDCIKYAHANTLGWHVNRFNQALVRDGTAITLTRQLLIAREFKSCP